LATARVVGAAKRIAADLRFARREAQAQSTSRQVDFDILTESYTLVDVADLDHHAADYVVSMSRERYLCNVVDANFGGNPSVTFDWRGEPDNPGTVTVQIGTVTKVVEVDDAGEVAVLP
jgi:hypothetical protein